VVLELKGRMLDPAIPEPSIQTCSKRRGSLEMSALRAEGGDS
jgi:hypothetical protein